MAKKARRDTLKRTITRRQLTRLEREERLRKGLTWGVLGVIVLVVGVLGYGLLYENVIKAAKPVATVNGVVVSVREFQARVRYERWRLQRQLELLQLQQQSIDPSIEGSETYLQQITMAISQVQQSLDYVGQQAHDELVREEMVRQEAAARGISVSEDELQRGIENVYFGYERDEATSSSQDATPDPTITPVLVATEVMTPDESDVLTSTGELTPTATAVPRATATPMTEEAFLSAYNSFLREDMRPLGVTEQLFRRWVHAEMLTESLRQDIAAEIPTSADQVQLRYLAMEGAELASETAARLDAGEDFQTLVDELEASPDVDAYSGEFPWYPRSILTGVVERSFGLEVVDLAFSLEVGAHSSAVAVGEEGTRYVIIQVLGHEERELEYGTYQQLIDETVSAWYEGQLAGVVDTDYQIYIPGD